MRRVGVLLVVAAYLLLLYTSLAAPAYARAHASLDPAFLAAFAAPWPLALACSLVIAGIALAVFPLRRGQRWAWWTLFLTLAICFFTRTLTDPRCFVVLDPHQHGCHTFVIASLVEVVGLALTWR
jgi:hypothetical protein